ncbi:hypothetical protein T05_7687 [Trichinella murrelli]|uniref:Uncharacterized protein n=1 Tax=Trichinella murrelli TaxID=144512 RepID=A0A0V0TFT5_9BILA|nr:hypothetical protein T05_7687 [Trichinella murrelli]
MPSADPSSNNSGLRTCSPYFHRLIRVLTPPPTPPPPTQFCSRSDTPDRHRSSSNPVLHTCSPFLHRIIKVESLLNPL